MGFALGMGPTPFHSASNVGHPSLRHRGVPDVPEDVDSLLEHLNDPNFDYSELRSLSDSTTQVFDPDDKGVFDVASTRPSEFDAQSRSESLRYSTASKTESHASEFEYNDESPYAEVRAAVTSVDDPTMPVNTFRTWSLGIFFTVIVSGFNQFFSMRYPSIYLSGVIVQLISLPCGRFLERVLPTTRFRAFGHTWSLNPGPFNIKEHVLITVMANVAVGGAYVTDVFVAQRIFYHETIGITYQVLLAVSSQLIGFSFGGFLCRFLVYPSSMIWPGALVNCALFNTLHRTYGKPDHHMSRHKFLLIVIACSFAWYFVPGYLWTGLSVFNWVCWIAPNNVTVNALFGTSTGLSMSALTFDWSMISYFCNPMVNPWWSEANTGVGFLFFFWIIAPILYFSNSFFMSHLPMSSSQAFDNTGMPYNITRIVTNNIFDITKYEAYSPAFLPTTLAMAYGLAFAAFSSLIVHAILWYRRDIMKRFRSNLKNERDIHSRLMQAYPEVPHWWYVTLGVTMLILLFVAVEVYPTQLPIWAVCIALAFAAASTIPVGMIQALTNLQVGLNVIFELFAGYILPGKPVAVMIFKGVALTGGIQAIGFAADMKLGHYMKIPPRMMFSAQVIACLVTCIASVFVQELMLSNIVDICHADQPQLFTCPTSTVFATASLLWGGIGPQRLLGPGSMYSPLLWFFLIGALLPVPFYYLARRYPLSYWRYVNIPVLFASLNFLPPATGLNYTSWLITGFLFQWFIRRYRFRWWMRYNYILAAGLDAGVAVGTAVVSLTLQLPKGGIAFNWWGNTVWQKTADALGTPLRTVAPGQTFGPSAW